MYDLVYSPAALKTLEKLDKNIQERIIIALERLRIRPDFCDIKKLVGMQGFRFRVGEYRVIFDKEETKLHILVLKIGHRKNVYE